MKRIAFLLFFIFVAPLSAQQNDSTPSRYIFYHPEIPYGSAVIRSPLDIFLNRGFSILVLDVENDRLGDFPWKTGFDAVRNALAHPGEAIKKRGGWHVWLHDEYWPSGAKVWYWAFVPNYTGHMIAGGITYRFIAEWYDGHEVPAPRLTAAITYMAMMVTNEVLESPDGVPQAGTLSDLLVNDPIGIILFSFDGPARFFAKKLQAADWSPQASIVFPGLRAQNLSQVMSYKIPLPFTKARMLLLIGQSGLVGGTITKGEYGISAAAGVQANTRAVDPKTSAESITATLGGGLFVDKNNSLLVSAILYRRARQNINLNVYPGVLPGTLKNIGVWTTHSIYGGWSFGLASRYSLGIGTGYTTEH